MAEAKGNKVELRTFLSWGKEAIIGYKTTEQSNRVFVNFVWCKVCARNEDAIKVHPTCKGKAKESMLSYITGFNFVTKHTINRHLSGKAHTIALEAENAKTSADRLTLDDAATATLRQPKINFALDKASDTAYRKMMWTAYEMSLEATMPLKHFKVLVKCQRRNGVMLIKGKDNGTAAKEYIHSIADAIREKVADFIKSNSFFSILSDGSQARKVKTDKEMIMIRTEKSGLPCYFVVSLAEMSR